jgi:hypothetical protein
VLLVRLAALPALHTNNGGASRKQTLPVSILENLKCTKKKILDFTCAAYRQQRRFKCRSSLIAVLLSQQKATKQLTPYPS